MWRQIWVYENGIINKNTNNLVCGQHGVLITSALTNVLTTIRPADDG